MESWGNFLRFCEGNLCHELRSTKLLRWEIFSLVDVLQEQQHVCLSSERVLVLFYPDIFGGKTF